MTDKDVKLVSTEELAEMDAQTQYLSPIFGSYASDVEMPVDKLNHDPIEPRIASEIIREYIGTEGNATPEPLYVRPDLHGARGSRADERNTREERDR